MYICNFVEQLNASRMGPGCGLQESTVPKQVACNFPHIALTVKNQTKFPVLSTLEDGGPTLSKDWQSSLGVWSLREVENAEILFLHFPVEVPCVPVHHVKSFCGTLSNRM